LVLSVIFSPYRHQALSHIDALQIIVSSLVRPGA